MSVVYVIAAIILAIIFSSVVFVIIHKIEHKNRHLNLNWFLLMALIALGCVLCMVLVYHAENDLTLEDTKEAYNNGFEAGVASEHHDYPSNEEVENWMASTKEVIISTHSDGSDPTIHIIDQQGDEWILIADEVNQNG